MEEKGEGEVEEKGGGEGKVYIGVARILGRGVLPPRVLTT